MKELCTFAQNMLWNFSHLDLYKDIQSHAGNMGIARLRHRLQLPKQVLGEWELTLLLLEKQGSIAFPFESLRCTSSHWFSSSQENCTSKSEIALGFSEAKKELETEERKWHFTLHTHCEGTTYWAPTWPLICPHSPTSKENRSYDLVLWRIQ